MRAFPLSPRWRHLRGSGGRSHLFRWACACVPAVIGLSACSPAEDWREVRIGSAGLTARFPCRPEREQRRWLPASDAPPAELFSCRHDEALYAVFRAELSGPDEVRAALLRLPGLTAARWQARILDERVSAPAGATPWPQARWQRLQGRAEGGAPVRVQTQVFGHGLTIHQVTVVTPEGVAASAADAFIAGVAFGR